MEEIEAERENILATIDYMFFMKDVEEHACGCKTPFAEGNMTYDEQGHLCDLHGVMVENEIQRRLDFKARWTSDIFSR